MKKEPFNQKELEAAEEQAEAEDIAVFSYELKRPFEYNGKTIEKLEFDFDKLTGADVRAIDQELRARNVNVIARSFNSEFIERVCIRACTQQIGVDAFRDMSFRDYIKITQRGRNFTLSAEL